jgi:hypothetical protein
MAHPDANVNCYTATATRAVVRPRSSLPVLAQN